VHIKRLAHSPFVPFGCLTSLLRGVVLLLEMSQWVWVCLGGLTLSLCGADLRLMHAFNFLAYVASQRGRGGFLKRASCLHRVPLACHVPLASEEVL